MKNVIPFIKDNIITGVVVVIPIALVAVILSSTLKKLVDATAPLTDNIIFGGTIFKTAIVVVLIGLILGFFFFINGLILKTYVGNSFKSWLENKILTNIPFFDTLKGVTSQLAGANKGVYKVVAVKINSENSKILGLLTDTLDDGMCIVYCPFSPVINIGQVHIVAKENISKVDMTVKEFTDIITKIGFESNKIHKKKINK